MSRKKYKKKHLNKKVKDHLYRDVDKKITINKDQLNELLLSEYKRGIEDNNKKHLREDIIREDLRKMLKNIKKAVNEFH